MLHQSPVPQNFISLEYEKINLGLYRVRFIVRENGEEKSLQLGMRSSSHHTGRVKREPEDVPRLLP